MTSPAAAAAVVKEDKGKDEKKTFILVYRMNNVEKTTEWSWLPCITEAVAKEFVASQRPMDAYLLSGLGIEVTKL